MIYFALQIESDVLKHTFTQNTVFLKSIKARRDYEEKLRLAAFTFIPQKGYFCKEVVHSRKFAYVYITKGNKLPPAISSIIG